MPAKPTASRVPIGARCSQIARSAGSTKTSTVDARVIAGRVRLELTNAHQAIARIVEALPGRVRAITVAQPTLEDVFIARTGHRYDDVRGASEAA